jgi:hypothetical protein
VDPSIAKAGDKVTVTAPDADCNPRYGQNARIHVTVTDATSVEVINTTAPMNDAGGFIYSFEVPTQRPPAMRLSQPSRTTSTGGMTRASTTGPTGQLSLCNGHRVSCQRRH